ncbi:hypothetical protein [Stenotrophomonas sp. 57]|uniref:hypothetical protein n=1 Tax=Stenotrophomonas sp. 57 TaxID=3051119 RepID=UPI00256EDE46|nr:hypothetical protein [Stenotrophomonas sp. 57]
MSEVTGRFNVTLGAVSIVFGVADALSPALAGFIVQHAGHDAAVLTLATIATAAVLLAWRVPGIRDVPAVVRA